MALRAAASTASKPTKKVHRISMNEPPYLLKRLRNLDISIFEASVVNEKEAAQFTQYPEWQTVWNNWSEGDKLCVLLSYLLLGFCNLLQKHMSGKERFARSWYRGTTTLVLWLATQKTKLGLRRVGQA